MSQKRGNDSNLKLYGRGSFIYLLLSAVLPSVNSYSLCWFYSLTGLPCAGCGVTHSISSIIKLNLKESVYYHPIGVFIFIGLIYFTTTLFSQRSRDFYYRHERLFTVFFIIGGVLLLIAGALRIGLILYEPELARRLFHPIEDKRFQELFIPSASP